MAAVLVMLPALSGCAAPGGGGQGFTQASRVGPDDGSDSCHAQAVALDNTGSFFGQDILQGAALGAAGGAILGGLVSGNLKGALIGAAAGGAVGAAGGYWAALQQQGETDAQLQATVTENLTRENAQINATQIAFDHDMDCRFGQAAAIRAAYKTGAITQDQAAAQMAAVKTLATRDLQLAQTIDGQIQSRGQQFDTAAENLGGGTGPAAPNGVAQLSISSVARRDTDLLLRPDAASPPVGQVKRRAALTITAQTGDYALVQTADGATGYLPLSALRQPSTAKPVTIAPGEAMPAPAVSPSSVQQLDGSNAASRDAFAQNVAVSRSAVSTGFQLAS
jgi:hypothetical protein